MTVKLTESFEETVNGGDGYDTAGWSEYFESVGIGTIDQDSAGPGSLPTGAGSECLYFYQATYYRDIYSYWTPAADETEIYARVYIYVDAAQLNNGADFKTIEFAGNAKLFGVKVAKDGSGNLGLLSYLQAANGTQINISEDTWYRVEIWYKARSGGAGSNDGEFHLKVYTDPSTLVGEDNRTGHDENVDFGTDGYVRLGIWNDASSNGAAVYFDLLKINDGDGWIGAESGGSGLSIPIAMHHYTKNIG